MKILQISPESSNFGSVSSIAEKIGQILLINDHKSYIAIGRYKVKSSSNYYIIGNFFTRIIAALKTRIFDNNGLNSSNQTKNLIKWINKIEPDLIHIHQLHGYYLNYKLFFDFLKDLNIPVIVTMHDCWNFTGHCAFFEIVSCEKWKVQCYNCELVRDYPKSIFYDNSLHNFKVKKKSFNSLNNLTITCVSNWLFDKVNESFLNSFPRQVILNGVDLNIFFPSNKYSDKINICKNKYIIMGVASPWDTRKGLNDFIELSKYIDPETVIVLIGLNKNQIKSLPKNIIGIPVIKDRVLIAKYYRSANLFLNLSIAESFGLTTIEAMACGTPVVVYNSSSCPELIGNRTGYIVEKNDIFKIFDIVKDHKSGNDHYLDSNYCVNWVKENFDSEKKYVEYLELYKKTLNN